MEEPEGEASVQSRSSPADEAMTAVSVWGRMESESDQNAKCSI